MRQHVALEMEAGDCIITECIHYPALAGSQAAAPTSRNCTHPMMACASHTSCSPPCRWLPAAGPGGQVGEGRACRVGCRASRASMPTQRRQTALRQRLPHTQRSVPFQLTSVERGQQALQLGLGIAGGVLGGGQLGAGAVHPQHPPVLPGPITRAPHNVEALGRLVEGEGHHGCGCCAPTRSMTAEGGPAAASSRRARLLCWCGGARSAARWPPVSCGAPGRGCLGLQLSHIAAHARPPSYGEQGPRHRPPFGLSDAQKSLVSCAGWAPQVLGGAPRAASPQRSRPSPSDAGCVGQAACAVRLDKSVKDHRGISLDHTPPQRPGG